MHAPSILPNVIVRKLEGSLNIHPEDNTISSHCISEICRISPISSNLYRDAV